MLAIQTVHTSGINLASLATILAGFAATAGLMMSFINRRIERRERQHEAEVAGLRQDFTDGLANMCAILSARLETKDTVAAINARLSRIEGTLGRQALCPRSAWE
jgi:hypothetical protein